VLPCGLLAARHQTEAPRRAEDAGGGLQLPSGTHAEQTLIWRDVRENRRPRGGALSAASRRCANRRASGVSEQHVERRRRIKARVDIVGLVVSAAAEGWSSVQAPCPFRKEDALLLSAPTAKPGTAGACGASGDVFSLSNAREHGLCGACASSPLVRAWSWRNQPTREHKPLRGGQAAAIVFHSLLPTTRGRRNLRRGEASIGRPWPISR
jgi:hypothetical protein